MAHVARAPVDVFEKASTHDRKEQLEAAKQADLVPYFRRIESEAGPIVEMEGAERIMLGSNNYLGLSGDARVKAAAREALERYGTGLTGSRFLNGTIDLHLELERELADWLGTEDAIVFSMEGDVAPLPRIAELCRGHGARLMVDEAHAIGVLGARGAGTSELLGVEDRVDLRMGTFSKSLASCGGFIAGPHEVVEYLRLQSRAFLFTAAAVPAAVGAALAALRVIRSGEGQELMARVLDNARYLRDGLEERGFAVVAPQAVGDGRDVVTPIVPVL